MISSLEPSDFCRFFVARLVRSGQRVLEPKTHRDRRGFWALWEQLDARVGTLRSTPERDEDFYRSLVFLRNSLQPSNNGSFDRFEAWLRDLQTSAVEHPNYRYEYLSPEFSETHAQSLLDSLDSTVRDIVDNSADAFLRGRSAASVT
jgi:hypothetical protein